jgi:hypothetical protein
MVALPAFMEWVHHQGSFGSGRSVLVIPSRQRRIKPVTPEQLQQRLKVCETYR